MSETVTMSAKEREYSYYLRLHVAGQLTIEELSTYLDLSQRQCYRIKARYLEEGDAGLVHRLRGKHSNFGYPSKERADVVEVYRTRYRDYGPTLFSERLEEHYGYILDPETIRRWLIDAHLWERKRKGRRHRKKRPRRSDIGAMVQVDGSHHDWFEQRGPRCCLFVFIDDASNQSSMRFAPGETEQGALEALRGYVERFGIPRQFYTDRLGVYYADKTPTAFTQSVQALGGEMIYAGSPQAKGRVERANRTHQDRLVKELREAGICDIEAANHFLETVYLDKHNARFSYTEGLADIHRPADGLDLDNLICYRRQSTVNHDMTIRVHSQFHQILPTNPLRPVPRQRVLVRHWLDGSMHVFWREQELKIAPCVDRPVRKSPPVVHPAEDHPWRKRPPIGKAKRMTIKQLCRKKP